MPQSSKTSRLNKDSRSVLIGTEHQAEFIRSITRAVGGEVSLFTAQRSLRDEGTTAVSVHTDVDESGVRELQPPYVDKARIASRPWNSAGSD